MVKCPECGEELIEKDVICPNCGEPRPNDSTNEKKSSNKLIAIIAIVVIIAIVGVLASGMFSSDNSTGDVKTESSTVDPISEDDDATSEPTEYWASAKAEKFHLPTCEWAEKISEDNKIVYDSREDAIADGKVPCGVCNP